MLHGVVPMGSSQCGLHIYDLYACMYAWVMADADECWRDEGGEPIYRTVLLV
jgi:hypothetical protein